MYAPTAIGQSGEQGCPFASAELQHRAQSLRPVGFALGHREHVLVEVALARETAIKAQAIFVDRARGESAGQQCAPNVGQQALEARVADQVGFEQPA